MDFDAFQPDESVSPIPQVLFFNWPIAFTFHSFQHLMQNSLKTTFCWKEMSDDTKVDQYKKTVVNLTIF